MRRTLEGLALAAGLAYFAWLWTSVEIRIPPADVHTLAPPRGYHRRVVDENIERAWRARYAHVVVAPSAAEFEPAAPADVEAIVRSTGFYQSKARNLIAMAQTLVDRFDGEVPTELVDLVTLAGVGRKTGNVVRSVAFGLPGLPVDTHVGRLTRKLGLTTEDDPAKVETALCALLPPASWGEFSLRVILHGRRVCDAKKPRCGDCVLEDVCPASQLPRNRQGSVKDDTQRGGLLPRQGTSV